MEPIDVDERLGFDSLRFEFGNSTCHQTAHDGLRGNVRATELQSERLTFGYLWSGEEPSTTPRTHPHSRLSWSVEIAST